MLLLSSCANKQKVTDITVYGDIGSAGAHWSHTLTKETGDLDKPTWDDKRFGMLCMTAKAFTDTEAIIRQMCQNNPLGCDYETQQTMNAVLDRMHAFAEKLKAKRLKYLRSKGLSLRQAQEAMEEE